MLLSTPASATGCQAMYPSTWPVARSEGIGPTPAVSSIPTVPFGAVADVAAEVLLPDVTADCVQPAVITTSTRASAMNAIAVIFRDFMLKDYLVNTKKVYYPGRIFSFLAVF